MVFVLDTRLRMHAAVHHYQEASGWCLLVEDSELVVTPPKAMIHAFCCVSGLHQNVSIVFGVCERYDRVEAVSED